VNFEHLIASACGFATKAQRHEDEYYSKNFAFPLVSWCLCGDLFSAFGGSGLGIFFRNIAFLIRNKDLFTFDVPGRHRQVFPGGVFNLKFDLGGDEHTSFS